MKPKVTKHHQTEQTLSKFWNKSNYFTDLDKKIGISNKMIIFEINFDHF